MCVHSESKMNEINLAFKAMTKVILFARKDDPWFHSFSHWPSKKIFFLFFIIVSCILSFKIKWRRYGSVRLNAHKQAIRFLFLYRFLFQSGALVCSAEALGDRWRHRQAVAFVIRAYKWATWGVSGHIYGASDRYEWQLVVPGARFSSILT